MNGLTMRLGRNQKVSGNKRKRTYNRPKLIGQSEGSPERGLHSDTGLPKKDRNISNKQPNPTPTRTGGTTTKTPQRK